MRRCRCARVPLSTPGSPLFTLDDDLQRAAVAENEAAVVNAKQAYDRAKSLLKDAVGTQKTFDDSEAALRSAEAGSTRCERGSTAGAGRARWPERSTRSTSARARWFSPAGRSSRSCRRGTSRCASSCRKRRCPAFTSATACGSAATDARADLFARVSFISAEAEFSPPVIYSLEERARLVFRIEAIPERPEDVRIGQPASVTLAQRADARDCTCREVRVMAEHAASSRMASGAQWRYRHRR